MKKVLSILLLIAMTFTIISCTVTQSTNTGTLGGETNTNTDGNSNTNTNVQNPPAILDYDKTVYQPKTSINGKSIYYAGIYSFKAPEITTYYNNYKAAISMTFDDGASLSAAKTAASIMSKYGFEGTLMLIGSSLKKGDVAGWQELVAEGVLDVGGHGWAHRNPNGLTEEQIIEEVKTTMDYLKETFPDENPLTFATPEAAITDAYLKYMKEYGIIANRLYSGKTISPKDELKNDEMLQLAAPRVDNGFAPAGAEVAAKNAVEAGNWFIELFHSVEEGSSSINITPSAFEMHCQSLYNAYNGEVWFGSYDDVAKYIAQSRVTTIEYTACDINSMTFFAKSEVDYGAEMTVKLYMPFFIDSAYVEINGEKIYTELKKETNARSVMVNIPISEEGVEIKLVMGGNDKYNNNCTHAYVEYEVVPSTATEFGYTEMICTNCLHTYKEKYTDKVAASAVSYNYKTTVTAPNTKEQ